ncbi:unnamed protein product, partial [Ectocarpus fasciculatus]
SGPGTGRRGGDQDTAGTAVCDTTGEIQIHSIFAGTRKKGASGADSSERLWATRKKKIKTLVSVFPPLAACVILGL